MSWFIKVLKDYAVFSGRAHRTEYWMFSLFYIIIYIVLAAAEAVILQTPFIAATFFLWRCCYRTWGSPYGGFTTPIEVGGGS